MKNFIETHALWTKSKHTRLHTHTHTHTHTHARTLTRTWNECLKTSGIHVHRLADAIFMEDLDLIRSLLEVLCLAPVSYSVRVPQQL